MISGGGTGGHIFPAIAIAQAIQARHPGCIITFVGAEGGMENRLVPAAGFKIEALWIGGLQRQLTWRNLQRNLKLPFMVLHSAWKARRLLRAYNPQMVIGVGGYASFPIVQAAVGQGRLTALQEQNAFPGLVNRKLGHRVARVFLGNPDAAQHLPGAKCQYTGNPVRPALLKQGRVDAAIAKQELGFAHDKPLLLLTGGSLGARALNQAMAKALQTLTAAGIQVLWQCGNLYHKEYKELLPSLTSSQQQAVQLVPFLQDMGAAYAAADLVVCRAGALTLSEMMALGQPAVLIPSPNVAGDHQTQNARSLANRHAAVLLPETQAVEHLADTLLPLLNAPARLAELRRNLAALQAELPKPDAATAIVLELERLVAQEGSS
jgi:UDP-N-acetylglucosamine--N-acetylmuramyl-(pentapeptide) pyrophosphoryl-undecaprenol N-acetylglucosamine transferase